MSYKFKTILEFPDFADDRMAQMREQYLATQHARDNTRYGWVLG